MPWPSSHHANGLTHSRYHDPLLICSSCPGIAASYQHECYVTRGASDGPSSRAMQQSAQRRAPRCAQRCSQRLAVPCLAGVAPCRSAPFLGAHGLGYMIALGLVPLPVGSSGRRASRARPRSAAMCPSTGADVHYDEFTSARTCSERRQHPFSTAFTHHSRNLKHTTTTPPRLALVRTRGRAAALGRRCSPSPHG